MKIMKAIGLADGFCPNHYTTEEKLLWCHEVSAGLRRSSKKIYDVLELIHTEFADFELPDDIKFDDIESVFINGKMLDKVDFRSFGTLNNDELLKYGINCGGRLRIKIIYLTHPKPIRDTTIVGEFNTGENFIEMNLPPFEVQDAIEVVALSDLTAEPDWSRATTHYIMEVSSSKIMLQSDAFTPQTAAKLAIRRVVDDETEVEAPYDTMYVEYLLAKMAHYDHDYDSYMAHINQYNSLLDEYQRTHKTNSPTTRLPFFRNYW